jgi:transcriptional regulator with XRE-family HTH domain
MKPSKSTFWGRGMDGLNIARTISVKRKEKGLTQDDLANFIGVSKSSVSKWETGQSYPDIVYLPQLAAYFNISLDELMGYEPQMTINDINRLYEELSKGFVEKPFDEVMSRCREIVKKYFSCFPLIYRMGLLYTNQGITAKDSEQKITALSEAKELLRRVKELSKDIQLKQLALHTEATCEMMLGNAYETIELLGDVKLPPPHKIILSQAYLMKGENKAAKIELQELILSNIMVLFEAIPPYLVIYADDAERFEEIVKRGTVLIDTFNLKALIPASILTFYLGAAQGYLSKGNTEKSLAVLEAYTDIATGDIYPLRQLQGDGFFDLIDSQSEYLTFGITTLPRNEKSIKQSIVDCVTENPAFSVLSDEPRYKRINKKLQEVLKWQG